MIPHYKNVCFVLSGGSAKLPIEFKHPGLVNINFILA